MSVNTKPTGWLCEDLRFGGEPEFIRNEARAMDRLALPDQWRVEALYAQGGVVATEEEATFRKEVEMCLEDLRDEKTHPDDQDDARRFLRRHVLRLAEGYLTSGVVNEGTARPTSTTAEKLNRMKTVAAEVLKSPEARRVAETVLSKAFDRTRGGRDPHGRTR